MQRWYTRRATGLSRAKLTRSIVQYRRGGELPDRQRGVARTIRRKYMSEGIRPLAKTDEFARDSVEVGDDALPEGAERRVRGQM